MNTTEQKTLAWFNDFQKKVLKSIENGESLAGMSGITKEEVEIFYSLGLTFYRNGQYKKAEDFFVLTTLFDFTKAKYWKALGAAKQMNKNYIQALASYKEANLLDLSDYSILIHMAECFLALGNKSEAKKMLEFTTTLSKGASEKNKKIHDQAEGLLDLLNKK